MAHVNRDPLHLFPAEIIIRITDFCSLSTITSLVQTSRSWQHFIDVSQADRIYSYHSKVEKPVGSYDLSYVKKHEYFSGCFGNLSGWKDVCKRETLLHRNWTAAVPETRESIFRHPRLAVIDFVPDLERRFFVTMSFERMISVICMETGKVLWSEQVWWSSGFQYDADAGFLTCERSFDEVETWRAVPDKRGCFEHFNTWKSPGTLVNPLHAVSLYKTTLCVAGFPWQNTVCDISTKPPAKVTDLPLDSSQTVVWTGQSADEIFLAGDMITGYQVHSKTNGQLLGNIEPSRCTTLYHVSDVEPGPDEDRESVLASLREVGPRAPSRHRVQPVQTGSGPHPDQQYALQDDFWSTMVVEGKFMAAGSSRNRLFISYDWPKLLTGDQKAYEETCMVIEWKMSTLGRPDLSVHGRRVALYMHQTVYVLSFSGVEGVCPKTIWRIETSVKEDLRGDAQCVSLHADSLMYTYVTSLKSQRSVQAIRVLTFAPELEGQEQIDCHAETIQ